MSDQPAASTTSSDSAKKPSRSPVERLIVWGFIAIGIAVAGIEAVAKFGFDAAYASGFTEEGDPKIDTPTPLAEFTKELGAGEPTAGESDTGNPAMVYSWFSLFKTDKYRIVAEIDDKESEDPTVLGYYVAGTDAGPAPGELREPDPDQLGGGGPPAPGGGGGGFPAPADNPTGGGGAFGPPPENLPGEGGDAPERPAMDDDGASDDGGTSDAPAGGEDKPPEEGGNQ